MNQIQANLWGGWTLAQPVTQRQRELEPGVQSSTSPAGVPSQGRSRAGRETGAPHSLSSLSVLGRPSERLSCVSMCHACVKTLLAGAGNSAATQPRLFSRFGHDPSILGNMYATQKMLRDSPGGPMGKMPRSQCRGLSLIPGQGTISHKPQLKISSATRKARYSQNKINKYIKKKKTTKKMLRRNSRQADGGAGACLGQEVCPGYPNTQVCV